MPACRRSHKSSVRRANLIDILESSCVEAMRVCRNCEKSGTSDRCKIGKDSDRCLECVRKACSCNLAPFSAAQWTRVQRQRAEKSSQVKETLSKLLRLQKELEALERKSTSMVEDELRNITDLEEEETKMPDIDFDVSSEQLEFSTNFDWSSLGVSSGLLGSSMLLNDSGKWFRVPLV